MEDEYLRQFMSSTRPTNLYAPNNNIPPPHHHSYDMLLFGASDPTTTNNTAAGGTSSSVGGTVEFSGSGFEMEVGAGLSGGGVMGGGGDIGANNNGRWPRQETLTLLEVRSRLDSKFKEANHKGPLWDELSRIMSEEHGYQRSGKKCREKFENLYKYYKKTKEGKAGRQDGKHYRFFRQLEALYGETNNNPIGANLFHDNNNVYQHHQSNPLLLPNNNNQEDTSFNLSNLSDSYTTSSDDSEFNEEEGTVKRKCKRSWKVKIKDFIDAKMRILMDKQEAWMEKMMTSIESKERERILREEEWRKQDAIRIERERKFWANERAWIETRDNELMDALRKLTGKELAKASTPEELIMNPNEDENNWSDGEVKRLIELRNGMEVKFGQCGILSEEVLWDEVASKLACCGYDRRNGLMCKEKWDSSVNDYHASLIKCNSKKRKENLISNSKNLYQQNNQEFFCDQLGGRGYSACDAGGGEQGVNNMTVMRLNDNVGSSPISNRNTTGNAMNDSCFRYFMGDAYGRIMD